MIMLGEDARMLAITVSLPEPDLAEAALVSKLSGGSARLGIGRKGDVVRSGPDELSVAGKEPALRELPVSIPPTSPSSPPLVEVELIVRSEVAMAAWNKLLYG